MHFTAHNNIKIMTFKPTIKYVQSIIQNLKLKNNKLVMKALLTNFINYNYNPINS